MQATRYGSLFIISSLAVFGLAGCADPAADKPKAVVEDAAGTVERAAGGQRFVIADGSTIGFTGSKVTGKHDGGFQQFEGTIKMVDGDPLQSTVEVQIDTTSLWSDAEKLTNHLKSPDFFDVANHPTASFVSTEIKPDGDQFLITGNLDLHGVTKSITFPARIEVGEDGVKAQAEFSIKRFDFGIVYPGKADDLIRDEVVIRLDLVAVPDMAAAA